MMIKDFKNNSGIWVRDTYVEGKQSRTESFSVWKSMMERCKEGSVWRKGGWYVGCSCSALFSDFQRFTDWYVHQVGYGCSEYHLDKDILVKGNKVYREDFCVLVPRRLNGFMCSSTKSRGKYPQGVYGAAGTFRSQLSINGKTTHIGRFKTLEEASAAYKVAKEAEAYRWYKRLRDGEFVVDPRVIERMRTWTFEERN